MSAVIETIRICSTCGHRAYRFSECSTCMAIGYYRAGRKAVGA